MKEPRIGPLATALILAWAVWVTVISTLSISTIVPNDENQNTPQTAQKQPTADDMSFIFRIGKFIDDHNGVFTAMATVFIAWFTYSLKSVARDQHKIMEKQTVIIERQTIASHRPKIIVRNVLLMNDVGGDKIFVNFEIVNIGGSDATFYRSGVEIVKMAKTRRGRYVFVGNKDFLDGDILSPGESIGYSQPFIALQMSLANLGIRLFVDDEILVLRGMIAYNDDNHTMRRTGFWREYDFDAKRFRPSDDTDYEYQD